MEKNKKLIGSLIVLIAIFGLTATVYLVQKPKQVTQTKASSLSYDFENSQSRPSWVTIAGTASYEYSSSFNSNVLKITNGTTIELPIDISSTASDFFYELKIDFYDNLDSPQGFIFAIIQDENNSLGGGINTEQSNDEYIYRQKNNGVDSYLRTGLKRTRGIHSLKIRITPEGSYLVIDKTNLSFLPKNGILSGIHYTLDRPYKLVLTMPWASLGSYNLFDNLSFQTPVYNQLLTSEPQDIERHYASLLLDQYPGIFEYALNSSGTSGPLKYRAIAQVGLAYAFKASLNREVCNSSVESTSNNCDKARILFRKMYLEREGWRAKWLSPATAYPITVGSWLIWNSLDVETQNWILNILNWEADYYSKRLQDIINTPNDIDHVFDNSYYNGCTYQKGFSRYLADSTAEDNGVAMMFLGTYAKMLENFPTQFSQNASKFELAAKTYGFHILTNGETDNIFRLTSKTISQRYNLNLIDNHSFSPSLNYSLILTAAANTYPFYQKLGQTFPAEYLHNSNSSWTDLNNFIDKSKYAWQVPSNLKLCKYADFHPCTGSPTSCVISDNNVFSLTGKDDWGGDLTWFNNAIALAPVALNNHLVDYRDLLKYEIYIRPDYLAFPQADNITLNKPDNLSGGVFYDNQGKSYITEQNIGLTERHIIAYLINNPDYSLPSPNTEKICNELTPLRNSANDASTVLQNCISNTPTNTVLKLPPGKYYLSNQIKINQPLNIGTQGKNKDMARCNYDDIHDCAELIATANLNQDGGMIYVNSWVNMDHIVINGNKENRYNSEASITCQNSSNRMGFNIDASEGPNHPGLTGRPDFKCNGCQFTNNVSKNALCGTGLAIKGDGLEISNNYFVFNGRHDNPTLVSDGLTFHDGSYSEIKNNEFLDNSDIDLIFGGCQNCLVQNNQIIHSNNFASSSYIGLLLYSWMAGRGDYTGSDFSNNNIDCGELKRCGFGLGIGTDSWWTGFVFGGSVHDNVIKNAEQGLNIDDAHDMSVYNNLVQNNGEYTYAFDTRTQVFYRRSTSRYNIGTRSYNINTSAPPIAEYTHENWDFQAANYYYRPDSTLKTCSLSAASSVSAGQPVVVNFSGTASNIGETDKPVGLWLTHQDGSPITGTIPGLISQALVQGKYYYNINKCDSTNAQACQKEYRGILSEGSYYLYCDANNNPGRCSGNPFCDYENYDRSLDCTSLGWASCSETDNQITIVSSGNTTQLSFKIKFQGIDSLRPDKTIRAILKQSGIEKYRFESVAITADDLGVYSGILPGVSPGTYDILIKSPTHLQKKFAFVIISSTMPIQDWTSQPLKIGDIWSSVADTYHDNKITAEDVIAFLNTWTSISVDVPANIPADYNEDGRVNTQDVRLLLLNYNLPTIYGEE